MTEKPGIKSLYYVRPSGWIGFKTFIWDGETRKFLGRTRDSWAKILLFYCIFYMGLAGFFTGLFAVFWQTIDMEQPKWQLNDSIIGTSPGLGYFPKPFNALQGDKLISYNSNRTENMTYWYDTVNTFLEDYIHPKNAENVDESCSDGRTATEGKFCPFKIELLDNCSPGKTDKTYGFPQKKPCVFLRLNKIFNWTPQVFNESSIDQLSKEEERNMYQKMPESLKSDIANIDARERNLIWVSCEGERAADVDNLGPIHYSPQRGFPAYYFPYKNVKGYQPPIVAVQFERPKLGVLIKIECRAWAKNIIYNRAERRGSARFILMVD